MDGTASRHLDYSTSIGRWAGVGPYYAMFPVDFAFEVVGKYSEPGDAILDPFTGRGSSVYAAAALGRTAHGIEINPVGWLYGQVKLQPAAKASVIRKIESISKSATTISDDRVQAMPEFFRCCYAPHVLKYLLAARSRLQWKTSRADATLMALILVYLHGKRGTALSNQMRQSKAMAPDYSVRWWKEHGHEPPELDPVEFLCQRVEWRYAKGSPKLPSGRVVLGDSTTAIPKISRQVTGGKVAKFDLLFTSPPYWNVTNYHYDQWLRLWMLGGPQRPCSNLGPWKGRFSSPTAYKELLTQVFAGCASVMSEDGVAYVRTDARPFTLEATIVALRNAFPGAEMQLLERPFTKETQTALYGDKSKKPGEVDIVVRLSN